MHTLRSVPGRTRPQPPANAAVDRVSPALVALALPLDRRYVAGQPQLLRYLPRLRSSTSTTPGSASVDTSPSSFSWPASQEARRRAPGVTRRGPTSQTCPRPAAARRPAEPWRGSLSGCQSRRRPRRRLTAGDLAQYAPHDLAAARLGQPGRPVDDLRAHSHQPSMPPRALSALSISILCLTPLLLPRHPLLWLDDRSPFPQPWRRAAAAPPPARRRARWSGARDP
jgi:hypothetical protein